MDIVTIPILNVRLAIRERKCIYIAPFLRGYAAGCYMELRSRA